MKDNLLNKKSKGSWLLKIFIPLFLIGFIFVFWTVLRFEIIGTTPEISLRSNQENQILDPSKEIVLGKKTNFHIHVQNKSNSICEIKALLKQNNREVILGEYLSKGTKEKPSEESIQKGVNLSFSDQILRNLKLTDGPAEIQVTALNCSIFKRKSLLSKKALVDLTPPTIQITSTQHYINQGGSDLATYRVSPDVSWSGIKIGPYYFTGFPKPGSDEKSGERFVLFVYSYELPPNTKIELVAIDRGGNESTTVLTPSKFFAKEFRKRELNIDDNFIQTKVADIISNTPQIQRTEDPLKNFLLVNKELRRKNSETLIDLSRKSEEKFLWKDAFRPLGNAAVEGSFADDRTYVYQGAKIDRQVHLGFDLATVERDAVSAAGDGKVLYAGYLGIYGNVVVIDHGYGLTSLYGHLSSLDVKVGDPISRGQKIGNTGTTGLAGGDHLHFSMLIQGVQVNPIEYWDQHWIQDHIYSRVDKNYFGKEEARNK